MRIPAWKIGLVVAGALALTLISTCFLASLAIQHQFISPPAAELRLGSLWILAGTTTDPTCPTGAMPCRLSTTHAQQHFFTIWVFLVTERRGLTEVWERNLVTLPLAP
jgi:hypothetical protein